MRRIRPGLRGALSVLTTLLLVLGAMLTGVGAAYASSDSPAKTSSASPEGTSSEQGSEQGSKTGQEQSTPTQEESDTTDADKSEPEQSPKETVKSEEPESKKANSPPTKTETKTEPTKTEPKELTADKPAPKAEHKQVMTSHVQVPQSETPSTEPERSDYNLTSMCKPDPHTGKFRIVNNSDKGEKFWLGQVAGGQFAADGYVDAHGTAYVTVPWGASSDTYKLKIAGLDYVKAIGDNPLCEQPKPMPKPTAKFWDDCTGINVKVGNLEGTAGVKVLLFKKGKDTPIAETWLKPGEKESGHFHAEEGDRFVVVQVTKDGQEHGLDAIAWHTYHKPDWCASATIGNLDCFPAPPYVVVTLNNPSHHAVEFTVKVDHETYNTFTVGPNDQAKRKVELTEGEKSRVTVLAEHRVLASTEVLAECLNVRFFDNCDQVTIIVHNPETAPKERLIAFRNHDQLNDEPVVVKPGERIRASFHAHDGDLFTVWTDHWDFVAGHKFHQPAHCGHAPEVGVLGLTVSRDCTGLDLKLTNSTEHGAKFTITRPNGESETHRVPAGEHVRVHVPAKDGQTFEVEGGKHFTEHVTFHKPDNCEAGKPPEKPSHEKPSHGQPAPHQPNAPEKKPVVLAVSHERALPTTGAPVGRELLAGMGLLGLGAAMVVVSRRRRA